MGKNLGHNRASGKELEHSIIGKIKSIMCIGLLTNTPGFQENSLATVIKALRVNHASVLLAKLD